MYAHVSLAGRSRAESLSRGVRLALALMAAMALALTGLASPARAAVNPDIKVGNLRLTKVDASKRQQDGSLLAKESIALLTFDWDASDVDIAAGDSFTIDVPAPFLVARTATSFPITYDFGDGRAVEVGTCTTTDKTYTCTFNEEMERRAHAGYSGAKGSGELQLAANEATTNSELTFTVNGTKEVKVDLPGDGGINPYRLSYEPIDLTKNAIPATEESTDIRWALIFGTERLQAAYQAAGRQVVFDGRTAQTITFSDTLGAGQKCPTQAELDKSILARTTSATDRNGQNEATLDSGAAGPTTTGAGTFELTITCGAATPAGTPLTVTATGPFAPQTNYYIAYRVPVDSADGKAVPGFVYTNSVSIDGTTLTETRQTSFARTAGIDVSMQLGYGTFGLTKSVTGGASAPTGAQFTVNVAYELPAGTTRADYPGWQVPGTLNDDARTGSATMTVPVDAPTTFPAPDPLAAFPQGTTITLSEDTTSVAAPDGYAWGEPAFTLADGTRAETFTISNGQTVAVTLTNTLAAAAPSTSSTESTASTGTGPTTTLGAAGAPAGSSGSQAASAGRSSARSSGGLARTGASILVPVALAAAALGGGVLALRRRRD